MGFFFGLSLTGPAAASNGRPGEYDEDSDEDEIHSRPADMKSDFDPRRRHEPKRLSVFIYLLSFIKH